MQGFIRTEEVLAGDLEAAQTVKLEQRYGNRDYWTALSLLEVDGPFTAITPWEIEGPSGKRYIEASGYSATPFGDAPPELAEFVRTMLATRRDVWLPQSTASPWRAALSANLIRLLTRELPSHAESRVFFSNSGTEAIEGAIKFAKASRPKGRHLINFTSAYHGKTFGALSLTPNAEYQQMFRPLLPGVVTLPYGNLEALAERIRRIGPDRVTAVIVEPIQGEGGVNIPPLGYLSGLGELCARHGIPVIADEIQTGLGRTGHWFESAAQGLDPDIIALAKPLGGGMVAVGATIARKKLFDIMLSGTASKRHSNTFGGNVMAMAVGLKSLEWLMDHDLPARSLRLGAVGLARLQAMQQRHPELFEVVRGQGLLQAMQFRPMLGLKRPDGLREVVHEATALLAMRLIAEEGVLVNVTLSQKRTLRLTPALTMPEDVYGRMYAQLDAFAGKTRTAGGVLRRTPPATLARLLTFAATRG